jgi:hypothetical protein
MYSSYKRCPICHHKLKETRYREDYWEVEYWYKCDNCGYYDGWYYGNYETFIPCEDGLFRYSRDTWEEVQKEIKRKIQYIKTSEIEVKVCT